MGQTQRGHKNNSGGLVSILQHLRAPAPVVSITWGAFKNLSTWTNYIRNLGGGAQASAVFEASQAVPMYV